MRGSPVFLSGSWFPLFLSCHSKITVKKYQSIKFIRVTVIFFKLAHNTYLRTTTGSDVALHPLISVTVTV